jgi:hypothetical protein
MCRLTHTRVHCLQVAVTIPRVQRFRTVWSLGFVLAATSCSSSPGPSAATGDAGAGSGGAGGASAGRNSAGRSGSGGAPRAGTAATSGGAGGTNGNSGTGAVSADAGPEQPDAGGAADSGQTQPDAAAPNADPRSSKRGVAYDFCNGYGARGQSDLDLLRQGSEPHSGITWFYNWGAAAGACLDGSGDPPVEYVPMVWGLTDAGSACESGGVCFNDGLTITHLIDTLPASTRFLLGFNEPNFAHQSNLTPSVAARNWQHLERIAEARELRLVGPATNYCDPSPNSDHAGSCTSEPAEHTFAFTDYTLTVPAGHRYNAFEWAELFYDECSADGAAGRDCQIDYQAGHVYSYWGLGWYIEVFKRKAGLLEASEAHCKNGQKDADEFAVDCGGNACAACSDWARAQFAKALWLTEFAPSTDDGPSPRPNAEQLVTRAQEYIVSELPKLEGDAYVFRYAWFMPRTDIGSLDHVDLLSESQPTTLTTPGVAYLNQPH